MALGLGIGVWGFRNAGRKGFALRVGGLKIRV